VRMLFAASFADSPKTLSAAARAIGAVGDAARSVLVAEIASVVSSEGLQRAAALYLGRALFSAGRATGRVVGRGRPGGWSVPEGV